MEKCMELLNYNGIGKTLIARALTGYIKLTKRYCLPRMILKLEKE